MTTDAVKIILVNNIQLHKKSKLKVDYVTKYKSIANLNSGFWFSFNCSTETFVILLSMLILESFQIVQPRLGMFESMPSHLHHLLAGIT